MNKKTFVALLIIPSVLGSFLTASLTASAAGFPVSVNVSNNMSSNWAGYVARNGSFTGVGATWIVPQATNADSNLSADATWVGIGGASTRDLIQAGTQTIFNNGAETVQAWYELLPGVSSQVPLAVHAGDTMTVSLAPAGNNEWQISFNDVTTGGSYQTSVLYTSSLSSAEWIEERPSDDRGFVSLDNFGTASFTNAYAIENGARVSITGAGAQTMTMINGADQPLATPGSLGGDGASFAVTRSAVNAAAAPAVMTPTTTTIIRVIGPYGRSRQFSSFFRNFRRWR